MVVTVEMASLATVRAAMAVTRTVRTLETAHGAVTVALRLQLAMKVHPPVVRAVATREEVRVGAIEAALAVRAARTATRRMRVLTKTQLRMVTKTVPRKMAKVAMNKTGTVLFSLSVRLFAMHSRRTSRCVVDAGRAGSHC